MKIFSVIGLSTASMLAAFSSAPAIAQTEALEYLTCRTALEGSPFEEIESVEAPFCCYVLEEIVWYTENDVFLDRFYRNSDERIHHTTDLCSASDSPDSALVPTVGIDPVPTGSVGVLPPTDTATPSDPIVGDGDVTPVGTGAGPANPGNEKPVGGAGEQPNGGDFGPVPSGDKGKSDS